MRDYLQSLLIDIEFHHLFIAQFLHANCSIIHIWSTWHKVKSNDSYCRGQDRPSRYEIGTRVRNRGKICQGQDLKKPIPWRDSRASLIHDSIRHECFNVDIYRYRKIETKYILPYIYFSCCITTSRKWDWDYVAALPRQL